MLDLVKQLVRYGPLTIEVVNREWKLGCLVSLPGRAKEKFIKTYNPHLIAGLKILEKSARETYGILFKEFRQQRAQQTFDYGTTNPDCKEIA
jgi:hypothetical protein